MSILEVTVEVPNVNCKNYQANTPVCDFLIMGRDGYECILFKSAVVEIDGVVEKCCACKLCGEE